MDKRKKRTSYQQYVIYIKMLEDDEIFRTGNIPRGTDVNYLVSKWDELAEQLNTCGNGPKLSAEEWKKRLNDWKNSTRAKYRRSQSDQKPIDKPEQALTPLEERALNLWGTSGCKTLSNSNILNFEQQTYYPATDGDYIHDTKPTMKEVVIQEVVKEDISVPEHTITAESAEAPVIEIPPKRIRIQNIAEAVTVLPPETAASVNFEGIRRELQRIANAKEEKLKLEIAKFKFRNPGFQYEYNPSNTQVENRDQ